MYTEKNTIRPRLELVPLLIRSPWALEPTPVARKRAVPSRFIHLRHAELNAELVF